MRKIEKIITSVIGRKGYSVYIKKQNNSYGVSSLKQIDQDILKNLITKKCEQYGLEYEIIK